MGVPAIKRSRLSVKERATVSPSSNQVSTRRAFENFTASLQPKARCFVLGHSDADGLTSTAILERILKRQGFSVYSQTTKKGENAWTRAVLEQTRSAIPEALFVCDLGSREAELIEGIPALLIDHHKPTGTPPGGTLLTGYNMDPVPTSGLLAFWCSPDEQAADLDWLVGISILGDLGPNSSFAEWSQAAKKYGATRLRQITTLINAPRRVGNGDAAIALAMLQECSTPDQFLQDQRIHQLEHAKQEFAAALNAARRVAPRTKGNIALITVDTPCQVHPMVAQSWLGRLRKNIVICANIGFLPARVNFAMRTALPVNLLDFLAENKPEGAGEDYGRGHNQATGGSLTLAQWNVFLAKLGFKELAG